MQPRNFLFHLEDFRFIDHAHVQTTVPMGVLAMFAYGGVRAMFLGLKFHLKAIFLGLNFANMNFLVFGGKRFQQLPFSLSSIM